MYQYRRTLTTGLAVVVCSVAVWTMLSGHAHADDGEDHSAAETQSAASTTDVSTTTYEYVAQPGDNLSLMVRRSIQLYTQAKGVSIDNAGVIYCETNTVQALGSHRLAVSENVSIPFDVLQQYIDKVGSLTTEQRAAWQTYANNARFELTGLEPTNAEAAQQAAAPQTESEPKADESTTSDTESTTNDSNTTSWYWWVIGGITLGGLFVLSRRNFTIKDIPFIKR